MEKKPPQKPPPRCLAAGGRGRLPPGEEFQSSPVPKTPADGRKGNDRDRAGTEADSAAGDGWAVALPPSTLSLTPRLGQGSAWCQPGRAVRLWSPLGGRGNPSESRSTKEPLAHRPRPLDTAPRRDTPRCTPQAAPTTPHSLQRHRGHRSDFAGPHGAVISAKPLKERKRRPSGSQGSPLQEASVAPRTPNRRGSEPPSRVGQIFTKR